MAKAGIDKNGEVIPTAGTSTLYDEKGNKRLQWVIKRHPLGNGKINPLLLAEEIRKTLVGDFPKANYVKPAAVKNKDVLHVYPVGDHHVGGYSWAEEVGDNYDLKISAALLEKAFGYLLGKASERSPALIVFLGDFLHFDSLEAITPTNKNVLDADSRFALVVRTALGLMKYAIEVCREKHSAVQVIIEQGNHDPASSIVIREALALHYANVKAVTIDNAPGVFHYYEFGKNLIGTHHGDKVRDLKGLAGVMANDRAEAWGRTAHRMILTGHLHQDKVIHVPGCRIESFAILPPADAWAYNNGYRPHRAMRQLQLHSELGEIARFTATPEMLGE